MLPKVHFGVSAETGFEPRHNDVANEIANRPQSNLADTAHFVGSR